MKDKYVSVGNEPESISPESEQLLIQLGIISIQGKYLTSVLKAVFSSWKEAVALTNLTEHELNALYSNLLQALTKQTPGRKEKGFESFGHPTDQPLVAPELWRDLENTIILEGKGVGLLEPRVFGQLVSVGLRVFINRDFEVNAIKALDVAKLSPAELLQLGKSKLDMFQYESKRRKLPDRGVSKTSIALLHQALHELLELRLPHGQLPEDFYPFYHDFSMFLDKYIIIGYKPGQISPKIAKRFGYSNLIKDADIEQERIPAWKIATLSRHKIKNMKALGNEAADEVELALAKVLEN